MTTLRRKGQIGGAVIGVGIALGIGIATYSIDKIRMGGELYTQQMMIAELEKDILPPPASVLEAFMESSLLVEDPASLSQRRADLLELEKDFNERTEHWRDALTIDDIKRELTEGTVTEGRRFWKELNTNFLPAADRGDIAAMHASHDRLKAIYLAQKQAIDGLTASAGAWMPMNCGPFQRPTSIDWVSSKVSSETLTSLPPVRLKLSSCMQSQTPSLVW